MNWRRNLKLSANALLRTRARTLLSASGLAIGIAAVVLLLGVGGGAKRALRAALAEVGENLLTVSAERRDSSAVRGAGRQFETLTLEDARAIGRLATVERVAPIALRELKLRRGSRSLRTTVIGTTPEFRLVSNHRLAAGRFLAADDIVAGARVAVVGSHVVRELFFGEQALGEPLLVAGATFLVVGVLREKGLDPSGADQDNRILIPIAAAQRRLLDVDYLDRIFVQAVSEPALPRAAEEIRELLRDRHALGAQVADDFNVRTQASLLATLAATDRTFSRLLAGLATLTLGLAALGLLALSLLAVRERRSEIGLRLAVGARPMQVLLQFLAEAVMVALLGALTGLLAGGSGILLGSGLLGWRLALTWEGVIGPILLSLAIAVASGAYPALRAACLDPIVALRG